MEFRSDRYENSTAPFLTGVIWGMAIGAVATLFLAPRRGAELREQVADSVNKASRRAVDTYNRASETATTFAGRAAIMAESLSDRAATMTAKLNRAISTKHSELS